MENLVTKKSVFIFTIINKFETDYGVHFSLFSFLCFLFPFSLFLRSCCPFFILFFK